MKSFLIDLFEYNHHVNQELAEVFCQSPGKIPEKSLTLFSHILNAHHIWNHRVVEIASVFGVWEVHTIQELKSIDNANFHASLRIINDMDIAQTIQYKNSLGKPFSNLLRDMLFHIINHATYHRGQIAMDFRAHQLEPLSTDYVFYKR